MNQFSQTFGLSIISNMAADLENRTPPTPDTLTAIQAQAEQLMEAQLNTDIPTLLTDFGLPAGITNVWGPAVFVDTTDIDTTSNKGVITSYNATATNTVVVFQTAANAYTVAIAGTKPTSAFDASVEDGEMLTLTNWQYGSPKGTSPATAKGTAIGVSIILGLKDAKYGTLQSFFQSLTGAGITVTFTGHSLGGGLAPAVALALFGSSTTLSPGLYNNTVNTQKWVAQVYATAGPDVGNVDYTNYFHSSFQATGSGNNPAWQQYNCKIWNSLDVVPQAWSTTYLNQIDSIYASNGLPTPDYVKCVITQAIRGIDIYNSGKNPYYPMDLNATTQFTGKFIQPSLITGYDCPVPPQKSDVPSGLCDFVAEMLYQHIAAYFALFGITPLSGGTPISPYTIATELFNKHIGGCGYL
ncbi:hypothetical protein ACFGVR_06580 [Mucilaginibacter sp. AW1-3]